MDRRVPRGALKDVELACEPWPAHADGSGRIKKSPTLLGPGEVQSGRSDATNIAPASVGRWRAAGGSCTARAFAVNFGDEQADIHYE